MQSRTVQITNALGMHARAAAKFVRLATSFISRVQVTRDARTMDGKSIMGLLLLAAGPGTHVTIAAEGPDESEAIEALSALVERRFEEEGAFAQ